MGKNISGKTQREVLVLLKEHYQESSKSTKTKILDEFAAVAGCHRKHAIRLLSDRMPKRAEKQITRIYDEAVQETLIIVWEAADRICGKRLHAILPSLIESMEHHGHIDLEPALRDKLMSVSAATIDRLLKPIRANSKRRRRKRKTSASRQVPTKTFNDWEETPPGFFEVDFVAHCGGTITGSYIHSLVATDVSSGWTFGIARPWKKYPMGRSRCCISYCRFQNERPSDSQKLLATQEFQMFRMRNFYPFVRHP